MAKYWLDTDVYLQACRGVLAFDLAPEFWEMLEREAKNHIVASPIHVCMELVEFSGRDDDICRWAKRLRNDDILFIEPDEPVLAHFTMIADYIHNNCDASEGNDFLNGADPWVIAHAMSGGAVAVSQEKLVHHSSKRVQVPNVCAHFNVTCIKTDALLRDLKK